MSYEDALEAAGFEVLEFEYFGSYQGQWMAHVKKDGEEGYIQDWYGSCSYCDQFEGDVGYCWSDDESEKAEYQVKLKNFGEQYTLLPASHFLKDMEAKAIDGTLYGDEREAFDWLRKRITVRADQEGE